MANHTGSLELVAIPNRPSLVIRDITTFNLEWPRMEANAHFLLQWRGIRVDRYKTWLSNYLNIFNAYIEPGVDLNDLSSLVFCLPNIEKSSKEKSTFEFPPNFNCDNPREISEIIMVYNYSDMEPSL
jgi:hypothetical protein